MRLYAIPLKAFGLRIGLGSPSTHRSAGPCSYAQISNKSKIDCSFWLHRVYLAKIELES